MPGAPACLEFYGSGKFLEIVGYTAVWDLSLHIHINITSNFTVTGKLIKVIHNTCT